MYLFFFFLSFFRDQSPPHQPSPKDTPRYGSLECRTNFVELESLASASVLQRVSSATKATINPTFSQEQVGTDSLPDNKLLGKFTKTSQKPRASAISLNSKGQNFAAESRHRRQSESQQNDLKFREFRFPRALNVKKAR